ncbi:hypothetical protein HYW59_01350 [Candidatus Kaiserbacteria bacterium]|nr:hypothetical protein [Candidatus Kaiserbacteria bacterium]
MMPHKTYMTVSTAIFALVALLHLARVLFGWGMAIYTWEIPFWASWVALLAAGYLAYSGYKLQK